MKIIRSRSTVGTTLNDTQRRNMLNLFGSTNIELDSLTERELNEKMGESELQSSGGVLGPTPTPHDPVSEPASPRAREPASSSRRHHPIHTPPTPHRQSVSSAPLRLNGRAESNQSHSRCRPITSASKRPHSNLSWKQLI